MKFLLVAALCAVALAAPQNRQNLASTTPVPIISMESEVNGDGTYRFSYQTGDGISRQEQGAPKLIGTEIGQTSQGGYSYTAPDGSVISVRFVADENGFQPVGDHIPTPPPMPAHVVQLLETLRRAGKL